MMDKAVASVIITLCCYIGKMKLLKEIEPVRLWAHFPVRSAF